ncbi:GNAT family N-acetyltransferase [Streptomyces odontomachi]|uniref:GNAT family N-acetyltransferase n=1 Tax=Streptomyces odontomachi TaxID=2944940 RepID=UPI00210BA687|nr:GNAT family N-acetyltransferase [Streptomyces sp. ODS25]
MTGNDDLTVRVADDPAEREACFAVRKEVFVREQGIAEDIEYDAHDAVALHVIAMGADGVPVGTGRLLHGAAAQEGTGAGPDVGLLGRLAVARSARGSGVGAALVRGIEDAARGLGLTAVDLHAQTQALGFYQRLGYAAYGPEFPDAGIPHRSMRREL